MKVIQTAFCTYTAIDHLFFYRIAESLYLPVHGKPYLAYRTGQSADLTVIGNLVFTPTRDPCLAHIT